MQLYRKMNFHEGIELYSHVFLRAMAKMGDFFIWFLFTIVWLAFLFHALYAEVGGNPNFSNISNAINMVIRTTFDLVSFEELVNNNAGFGYGYDVWLPTTMR